MVGAGFKPAPTEYLRLLNVWMQIIETRFAGASGLLRRTEKYFADKALRRLREDRFHGVGDVLRLEHLARVAPGVRRKIGGDRAGTYRGDANAVGPEVFRHARREAQQAPLRRAVDAAAGHRILACERGDVDDVPAAAANHSRRDGSAKQEHRLQIGV